MSNVSEIVLSFTPEQRLVARASRAGGWSMIRGKMGYALIAMSAVSWLGVSVFFAITLIVIHRWIDPGSNTLGSMNIYAFFGALLGYLFFRLNHWLTEPSPAKSPAASFQTDMRIDASGIHVEDQVSRVFLSWAAIEAVVKFRGGFGVRSGNVVYPAPASALPADLSLNDAVDLMKNWREADKVFG